MSADRLRSRWRGGGPSFGAWLTLPSPVSAELVARCGFDWVCIDLQHGFGSLDELATVAQSVSVGGALPLARVAGNDHWLIGRALDLGARGVIVPLVDGPEDALHAVAASRYPPVGSRSYGPMRTDGSEADPLCVVMCETRGGLERLAETCTVPGVDGIYVGPRDLALTHELSPGPEVDTLIGRILDACRRAGVPAGIQTRSGDAARAYTDQGFAFASVATDRDLLAQSARAELAAALGGEAPPVEAQPDGILRATARYD